jgi:hypothetical protein
MMIMLGIVGGFVLACLLARGEAAGADTRAYWAAGRLWLSGGDPYHPSGPFMPYVYSPWMLPLFVPWSILPWDVAWFVWRGATSSALLWSVHWAYKRRPMTTAILLVLLAFPLAANLDTGNINLPLRCCSSARSSPARHWPGCCGWSRPRSSGCRPCSGRSCRREDGCGALVWFVLALMLTALTLPQTLVQLQVLFSFQRPLRVDYLVFVWAIVPWAWRHPEAFRWLIPSTWPGAAQAGAAAAKGVASPLAAQPGADGRDHAPGHADRPNERRIDSLGSRASRNSNDRRTRSQGSDARIEARQFGLARPRPRTRGWHRGP